MEGKDNKISIFAAGFIGGFIIASLILESMYQNKIDRVKSIYQNKIVEANKMIRELNESIEDAKSSAWEGYEEMGEALDSLETAEEVYLDEVE